MGMARVQTHSNPFLYLVPFESLPVPLEIDPKVIYLGAKVIP